MPKVNALTLRCKILGVLLQAARLKNGRTKKECAQALGISSRLITAYEEGRRDISLPELELLAFYLSVPVASFWKDDTIIAPEDLPSPERLTALRQRVIAVLLHDARIKADKSLKDLAHVIEKSPRIVGEYERGERAIPLVHLELLADYLGVPMMYFLDEGVGPIGEHELVERLCEQFQDLPEDVQQFVVQPLNLMYVRVAMRLARMSAAQLRGIAEGLLEITY